MPLPRINPLCVFVTLCEYRVPSRALTLGLGGGDNQICDSLKLSFQEACVRLGSGDLPQAAPQPTRIPESSAQPSDESWQQSARQIIEKAQERL